MSSGFGIILFCFLVQVNCQFKHYKRIGKEGPPLNNEIALRRELLKGYDPVALPVKGPGPIQIAVDLALNQVVDVSEAQEKIQLSIWYRIFWYDEWLKWNTTTYNISTVRFHASEIWIPDVTIYNQFPGPDTREHYVLSVTPDGQVTWRYPLVLDATCGMNVEYFPFDTQVCKLLLASWQFDISVMNVSAKREIGDMEGFVQNGEWHVRALLINRTEKMWNNAENPWPEVTFSIVLQRRSLHYVWNLVMPCIALLGLHSLGFFLPPASGEKVSLGVTALLAFTVYLLMVSDKLPPHSTSIPILAKFFGTSIVFMTIANACEVVSLNVYYKYEFGKRPPKCFLRLLNSWIFKCLYGRKTFSPKDDKNFDPKHFEQYGEELLNDNCKANANGDEKIVVKEAYEERGDEISEEQLMYEWSMMSLIINRFSMVTFIIGVSLNTAWLFFTPPPFTMPDPMKKIGY